MISVRQFNDPYDLRTFQAVLTAYEGTFPIAPVLHQILTNTGLMHMFIAIDDATHPGTVVGAGVLKTPEAAVPIGAEIRPLAWVVSDMVTHPNYRRLGVARVLLRHMEEVVDHNGGRIIYLYTKRTNGPAKSLYEKAGFERLRNQGSQAIYAKLTR